MALNELGTGGLLYITQPNGIDFINSGIENNSIGVEQISRHATVGSPIGFKVNGKGLVCFENIGIAGFINSLSINGVEQFGVSDPIAVSGLPEQAATDLADAVNAWTPISGANYKASAVGIKVTLTPYSSVGSDNNGDTVVLTVSDPLITFTTEDVSGGSDGSELISPSYGARYFMNTSSGAVEGDITGAEEITSAIVKRGTEASIPTLTQQVANDSITSLERITNITYLNLTASGATDLKSIEGSFALGDILIAYNSSAFAVTLQDLSIDGGNLIISPSTFEMLDSNYVMWMMYVNDTVSGQVFKEINRTPSTFANDSVSTVSIVDNAITTAKIINDAVTTDKIINDAITTGKIINDAITTDKIINDAVTSDKILNQSVTSEKLALTSVDASILATDAVTVDKILNGAVTLEKLDTSLTVDMFTFPISWETGKQGIIEAKIPYKCSVTEILISISSPIASTDEAIAIFKDNGSLAMGQSDIPQNTPLGNGFTVIPVANNEFLPGEVMRFETTKPTAGGEAVCTVCVNRVV